MRILHIDVDSLRPDHLGCYGYLRETSPNIDRLAAEGVRFENCYVSDAPCLPSRTALWSGRAGFHTGVINHGGEASQPFVEGPGRMFRDSFGFTGWMRLLRNRGLHTATISSFGERHSAWHWYAGFNEIVNPGTGGLETADKVAPLALEWLENNAKRDAWYLHVNFWDPHTPYNTPDEFGNPFESAAMPAFFNEEMRERCWNGFGPHSAQEPHDYGDSAYREIPRMPKQIDSMAAVKRWVDGYDCGVRFMDDHVGRILNALADEGVLDDTMIVLSADHGENLGELNVWGDHQTADQMTSRIPLIVRWPAGGVAPRVDKGLHYQFDFAATVAKLAGETIPDNWDGLSFAGAFKENRSAGRPFLVLSQGAWSCQRSVRFEKYLCMRTYHDGFKELEPLMLFDLDADPHEQRDLAEAHPKVTEHAMSLLEEWQCGMMLTSRHNIDPMMTVLREGGPFHCKGYLPAYLERLKQTSRSNHADRLAVLHPTG